jgi:hypothetical protein
MLFAFMRRRAPQAPEWHRGSGLRHRCAVRPRVRPRLEVLEARTLPSTYTVVNLADSGPGSLRQALQDADNHPGADVIDVDVTGTITLTTGAVTISDDVKINGSGADRFTISGNDSSRVMAINHGVVVSITGVTIAHGRAATASAVPSPSIPLMTVGGGIFNDGGAVTISDVNFADNSAVGVAPTFTSAGGAIANLGNSASMTVDHCAFVGNRALGAVSAAGAIASLFGARLDISHSAFVGDVAVGAVLAAGGAIGNDGASSLAVDHSVFTSNQAVALRGANPLSIFQGHAVGGAILNSGGARATVSHCTLDSNDAIGGNGGGPFATGGEGDGGAAADSSFSAFSPAANAILTLVDDLFAQNHSRGGNGASAASGTGASGGNGVGGAVVNISAELIVMHSTFLDNQAVGGAGGQGGSGASGGAGGLGRGAAIHNTFAVPLPQSLAVTDSILVGNQATGGAGGAGGSGGNGGPGGAAEGGAVRFLFGNLTLTRSVIVGNRATGGVGGSAGAGGSGGPGGAASGGGIAIGLTGFSTTAAVNNCIIAANLALGGSGGSGGGNGGNGLGGGVWNNAGSDLTLDHDAITLNQADGGADTAGGNAGLGVGGGLYNLGHVVKDAATDIIGNHASTSNDDCFGLLC